MGEKYNLIVHVVVFFFGQNISNNIFFSVSVGNIIWFRFILFFVSSSLAHNLYGAFPLRLLALMVFIFYAARLSSEI